MNAEHGAVVRLVQGVLKETLYTVHTKLIPMFVKGSCLECTLSSMLSDRAQHTAFKWREETSGTLQRKTRALIKVQFYEKPSGITENMREKLREVLERRKLLSRSCVLYSIIQNNYG